MMRKTNTQSLKEVISNLVEAYKLQGKLDEVNLIGSWERLMGKMIAKHTLELYINNKTLFIKLDSPALRQELSYSKAKIIEILNNEIGHELIKDVVIR